MSASAASRDPRVLLVSRTRHQVPLDGDDARKFAALDEVLAWHLLARSRRRYRSGHVTMLGRAPLLDGVIFHLRLPFAIARAIRRLQPHVVVAQDPFVGAAALLARLLTRSDVAVVVEVHGDWRTATRLYGSRARRMLGRPADAVAEATLRRADAVRAVSAYTAELVRAVRGSVEATFPAFLDLGAFFATPPVPPPDAPVALFVGVLERYKNIDGLLKAWQGIRDRAPEARLRIVGDGALSRRVARSVRADASIEHRARLSRGEIAASLDDATCLVLPSRSEGMGRVVIEALARGRAIVATETGGLPELVRDGVNGLLVPPNDTEALGDALATVLTNRSLAVELGENSFRRAVGERLGPDEFARALRDLTALALSRRAPSTAEPPSQQIPALRG